MRERGKRDLERRLGVEGMEVEKREEGGRYRYSCGCTKLCLYEGTAGS